MHAPRKDHCKGNQRHSTYKDQARQVPNPRTSLCLGTHCESALCCCLNFRLKTEAV